MTVRTALYRFYDIDGQLLYVGVTTDLARRWDQHSHDQPWWHLVKRRDVEWHDDRSAAEEAEAQAVRSEAPKFNKDHVPNRRLGQGDYDDSADKKRVRRLLRRDIKDQYLHVGMKVHIDTLAERYKVSPRTVLSVIITSGNDRCFSTTRRRLTVLGKPTF